jgi:hypothetical protein
MCRPARRESSDHRHVEPSPCDPAGNGRRNKGDPRNRARDRACCTHEKRNPTAVQSGNRSAALLGERSRRKLSRSTVSTCTRSPGSHVPNGPRRAQAGSRLAENIGSMPDKAHEVSSRLTPWAFWFSPAICRDCCTFAPKAHGWPPVRFFEPRTDQITPVPFRFPSPLFKIL